MATTLQGLKDIAKKVTGKTPVSNTENGALAEFANNYTAPQPPDLSDYYTKEEVNQLLSTVNGYSGTFSGSSPTEGYILSVTYPQLRDTISQHPLVFYNETFARQAKEVLYVTRVVYGYNNPSVRVEGFVSKSVADSSDPNVELIPLVGFRSTDFPKGTDPVVLKSNPSQINSEE